MLLTTAYSQCYITQQFKLFMEGQVLNISFESPAEWQNDIKTKLCCTDNNEFLSSSIESVKSGVEAFSVLFILTCFTRTTSVVDIFNILFYAMARVACVENDTNLTHIEVKVGLSCTTCGITLSITVVELLRKGTDNNWNEIANMSQETLKAKRIQVIFSSVWMSTTTIRRHSNPKNPF